jgi:RNA polymerase sigma-70 factor, ECF subfamily
MSGSNEIRLIHELQQSNVIAFNELFKLHYQQVFNFSYHILNSKEDAEEIVQTVFIAVWENRVLIDPDRSFSTYIFSIARHHIYNTLKKRVFKKAYLENLSTEPESDSSTENEITCRELQLVFERIIETLPAKRREIFRLSREEGLTYKQIAERTGVSENTVDTQIRKSLHYIRSAFNKL